MRRILFLCLLAITGFIFSVTAQDSTTIAKKTPQEKMQAQMKHLKKELNLTSRQEVSVDSINQLFVQQTAALRNGDGDRKGKLKAVKQALDNRNEAMKAVLTSDQYATYEKLQEEQKEKLKERRGNRKVS